MIFVKGINKWKIAFRKRKKKSNFLNFSVLIFFVFVGKEYIFSWQKRIVIKNIENNNYLFLSFFFMLFLLNCFYDRIWRRTLYCNSILFNLIWCSFVRLHLFLVLPQKSMPLFVLVYHDSFISFYSVLFVGRTLLWYNMILRIKIPWRK